MVVPGGPRIHVVPEYNENDNEDMCQRMGLASHQGGDVCEDVCVC